MTSDTSLEPVVALTKALVAVPSISPDSSSTQDILIERLVALGFTVEPLVIDGVRNFFARWGNKGPLLVFSGHTDVVPTGEQKRWTTDPFDAVIREERLFGRGSADMKGAIAAMVIAVEEFLAETNGSSPLSIGFLITGDEELGGAAGNAALTQILRGHKIDYCIVGEPTSESTFGDTIKIGRRGSLTGHVTFRGRQGHVGYPHLADNALHRALESLSKLSREEFGNGGEHFQPTSFQVVKLSSGVATNVIPGEALASFNFRFSYYTTAEALKKQVNEVFASFGSENYEIEWEPPATPFLTVPGHLHTQLVRAVKEVTNIVPSNSTAGGISDARHFAAHGIPVVEFGPLNKTIHQYDENVSLFELRELVKVYKRLLSLLSAEIS